MVQKLKRYTGMDDVDLIKHYYYNGYYENSMLLEECQKKNQEINELENQEKNQSLRLSQMMGVEDGEMKFVASDTVVERFRKMKEERDKAARLEGEYAIHESQSEDVRILVERFEENLFRNVDAIYNEYLEEERIKRENEEAQNQNQSEDQHNQHDQNNGQNDDNQDSQYDQNNDNQNKGQNDDDQNKGPNDDNQNDNQRNQDQDNKENQQNHDNDNQDNKQDQNNVNDDNKLDQNDENQNNENENDQTETNNKIETQNGKNS